MKQLTWLGTPWGGLHVDLDIIPPHSLIISAGLSHDISFDKELINRKNCIIIGVDPTWVSAKTLLRYYLKNINRRKQFRLVRKAVYNTTGLTIRLGGAAVTSLSPQGHKVKTISLDDLISSYPGAALLKLDIEGAEFPALESLQQKLRIPQIAISFHVWLNSENDQYPNLGVVPGFYTHQDVINNVNKIKTMGYKLVYKNIENPDHIGQETLFIRNDFSSNYVDINLEQ